MERKLSCVCSRVFLTKIIDKSSILQDGSAMDRWGSLSDASNGPKIKNQLHHTLLGSYILSIWCMFGLVLLLVELEYYY